MDVDQVENLKLVSIAEARKVMCVKKSDMTDEEVAKVVFELTSIARQYVKSVPN